MRLRQAFSADVLSVKNAAEYPRTEVDGKQLSGKSAFFAASDAVRIFIDLDVDLVSRILIPHRVDARRPHMRFRTFGRGRLIES
jgi:hypothetical protein